jgi:rhodanese-related sulfurtransferase
MNLGIGLSFQAGLLLPAYLLGGALVILQLIVIASQFCVASWMLEGFWALRGHGTVRVNSEEAHRLVADGGVLVDVRAPSEFAADHLPGAINLPVDEVKGRKDELRQIGQPLVLYCSAGVRCHKAAKILRRAGIEDVHELGSISRW